MIVVQDLVLEGFMVLEASEINLSEYSVQLYGTTLVHYTDHRINQRLSYVYSCTAVFAIWVGHTLTHS